MGVSGLWVYLDDEGGRAPDLPGRMVAEGRRLAGVSGLRPCGIVRTEAFAQTLCSSGQTSGLDTLYVLTRGLAASAPAPSSVAERLCAAIETCQPQLLVLPANALGTDIGARVAARLGRAFLSRCVDFDWRDERPVVRRAAFGNRAHQIISPLTGPPWIATVDMQVMESTAAAGSGQATIEILDAGAVGNAGEGQVEVWRVPARELDVSDADIVLSVGRGVSSQETLEQIHALAEVLGAAVGGSREAVFAGMVPREQQVGASGKWIAPRVYVALGISGSTYHMMGIREAKHIVAVNLDPGAPIIERAEIGVIDDLTRIVPALITASHTGWGDGAEQSGQGA